MIFDFDPGPESLCSDGWCHAPFKHMRLPRWSLAFKQCRAIFSGLPSSSFHLLLEHEGEELLMTIGAYSCGLIVAAEGKPLYLSVSKHHFWRSCSFMERRRRGWEERLETEEAFDLSRGGLRGTFLAAAAPGEVTAIAVRVLDLWSVRRRAYAPSSSLAHLPTYEAVARSLFLSATTLTLQAKQSKGRKRKASSFQCIQRGHKKSSCLAQPLFTFGSHE